VAGSRASRLIVFSLTAGIAWSVAACASSAPARQSAVPAPRASSPVARTQDPPAALAPRSNSQPGLNGVRGWTLLGLGDSIPGAAYCAGCTSFVQLYSNRIQADTGTPVKALNLADNSGIDSARLLSAVRGDPAVRSAVRRADVITLSIGANDSIPDDFAYLQGRCGGPDNIECYVHSLATFEHNERAILAEIRLLRGTSPTAIRVTTYYNPLVGNELSVRTFGPDFALAVARPLIERLDAAICREVALVHGTCIDLYHAFNGPDGTRDAGSLLSGDHIHPSQEGHRLIAQLLAAAGYEPLTADRRTAAVGGGSSVVRR